MFLTGTGLLVVLGVMGLAVVVLSISTFVRAFKE
jgi:hypothetical protein